MTTTTTRPDYDWLLAEVQDMADEDETIDPAEDLTLYGIDSVAVMRLTLALEEKGVKLGFEDLARTPTIDAWWALIRAQG